MRHIYDIITQSVRIKANHNYQRLPKSRSSHGCQQIHDYYEDLHLSHINAEWEEKAEFTVSISDVDQHSHLPPQHTAGHGADGTPPCSFCTTCDVEVKQSAKSARSAWQTRLVVLLVPQRLLLYRHVITVTLPGNQRTEQEVTVSRRCSLRYVSNHQRGCFNPVLMLS